VVQLGPDCSGDYATAEKIHQGIPLLNLRQACAMLIEWSWVEEIYEELPKEPEWDNGFLARLVTTWMALAGCFAQLRWNSDSFQFYLTAAPMGILGLQLMQCVSRRHDLSLCSGCGIPYLRQGRKAQKGRRNYCNDCGRTAALRDAQREQDKDRDSRKEDVSKRSNGKAQSTSEGTDAGHLD
jgi:hypothetical protein